MEQLNILAIDTECTGAQRNHGHPFDPRNKCCYIGVYDANRDNTSLFDIEYSGLPYGRILTNLQNDLNQCFLVIGFNIKYDLHWLRRYTIDPNCIKRVWDCQLAHFILTHQKHRYPSMDEVCEYYGIPLKPAKIHEYWDMGMDTDEIPQQELEEYLAHDVKTTYEIYLRQKKELEKQNKIPLFRLDCADLLVLAEMEWNGMKYDLEKSLRKAEETEHDLRCIRANLYNYTRGICPDVAINLDSRDHISCLLYGGTITYDYKIPNGVYKTGAKAGQPRYSWKTETFQFPRLVEPLEGTELKKEGFYSTDEETLIKLKAIGKASEILDSLLRASKLSRLVGTYYRGIPSKFELYGWEEGIVHGQINQCVAQTGRTSSSNPNLQNIEPHVKECFITRF